MDTKKLKEEIKLLERKLELMEQYNELKRMADEYNKKVSLYPSYPAPVYPKPIYPNTYPWWQTYPNWACYTTSPTISRITTCGANGQATSDTTVIRDDAQVSYTN